MMKKRLTLTLAALVIGGISLLAQGRIQTRKYRFSDFPDKVTKVVLTGNELLGSALQQEIVNSWTASAFEFSSLEEFEKLKTNENYYFLILAEILQKGEEEPGMLCLSLVKGGPKAAEGLGAMDEIVSIPVSAAMGSSGRELTFAGAMVVAVQDYTLACLESEVNAYQGTEWFNQRYDRLGHTQQVMLCREDLSVPQEQIVRFQDEDMHIVDADEADAAFLEGRYNTLVSYVTCTATTSWQMLLRADTREIYYIKSHKISDKKPAGFLLTDIKSIARNR